MKLKHNLAIALTGLALAFPLAGPAQAKVTNDQLVVGMSQEFETLNPVVKQMFASTVIYNAVGWPLVAINADWKWACWLCTKLPSLSDKSAKVITEGGKKKIVVDWEIKKEAVWGDGTPITGEDFKFSWEVGKSDNVAVGEREVYTQIEEVTVDAKNPKKFTTKFSEARYDFFQLGTFAVMPKHLEGPVWEKTKGSKGQYEKETLYATAPTTPGLYNGPYTVKEIKLGSHVMIEPNPKFFGKKPKIKKVIFKVIPNTQTLEANLLSGTIDMVNELGFTFDQALSLEKRINADPAMKSKFSVTFKEGMTYEHIDLKVTDKTLSDLGVRQALVYAINREELVKTLFEARQKVALHMIHPKDPYYTDKVTKFPYNPKKAEELLDKAGWKKGADGMRAKDGQKMSFTIMTTAGNKVRELVEVFLQQEWKKVGIEIKIKNEPARVYFGETVRKGQYPHMAMFAWVSSPDNPPRSQLHSTSIPTAANAYAGQNSGGWSNKKVDDALDKIKTEFDFNKRKALMAIVQEEYAREVPVIPLYLRAEIVATPTNLKGFKTTGHQFPSTLSIEDWYLE